MFWSDREKISIQQQEQYQQSPPTEEDRVLVEKSTRGLRGRRATIARNQGLEMFNAHKFYL